ncbi:hypothetical protein GCM10023075_48620 [Streptosporangium album]
MLAAAAAFSAAALTWFAFARETWQFVAVMVLYGTARALSSGPAQAWHVDALHALEGPDADLKPGLSRGGAAGSVSLCVGMLAGTAVAWTAGAVALLLTVLLYPREAAGGTVESTTESVSP